MDTSGERTQGHGELAIRMKVSECVYCMYVQTELEGKEESVHTVNTNKDFVSFSFTATEKGWRRKEMNKDATGFYCT